MFCPVVRLPVCQQGISVTRTLGDVDMVVNGCIPEPEIKAFRLTKRDRAVIIASDGLWDTDGIIVKDVTSAVSKSRGVPQNAVNVLMKNVRRAGGPNDDCTVACLAFQR